MESTRQHSPPAPPSGAVWRTCRSLRVPPSGTFPSARPWRSGVSSLAPALLQLLKQLHPRCSSGKAKQKKNIWRRLLCTQGRILLAMFTYYLYSKLLVAFIILLSKLCVLCKPSSPNKTMGGVRPFNKIACDYLTPLFNSFQGQSPSCDSTFFWNIFLIASNVLYCHYSRKCHFCTQEKRMNWTKCKWLRRLDYASGFPI